MRFQQWFESLLPKERKRVVSMLFSVMDDAVPEGYRELFIEFRRVVDDEYHHLKNPH